MAQAAALLSRLLFTGSRRPDPAFWTGFAWAALLFVATRAAVLGLYSLRHFDVLQSDPGNYIAIADYLTQHGHLPSGPEIAWRQFPGLALLMALVNPLVGNMERTGYLVSWACSLGSVLLFHRLFRDFRLTLLYVVFVPSWVACSTLIMSEGLTFLLLLTAVWALCRESRLGPRLLLLAVAGFALVARNTALFFLLSLVLAWWWSAERDRPRRLILYLLALGALPGLYLAWNLAAVGTPFPQKAGQETYFAFTASEGYPTSMLAAPGRSLLHGLGLASVPLAKKLSVVASLLLAGWVVVRFLILKPRAGTPDEGQVLRHAFGWATLAHTLFHLCLGGSFGFSSLDRYISHAQPALALGLAPDPESGRRIRLVWIALLALVGILFAGLTGHAPVTLFHFLKPEPPL